MFVLTAHIHKKRAILLLVAAIVAIALIIFLFNGMRNSGSGGAVPLASNENRITYLQSWGWEVNPEPVETLQLLLPDQLSDGDQAYNELQKEQGFDLTKYCGKQVSRYTYTVTNYPDRPNGVQVNLYICEEQPVAGDVIAAGANGFQSGLKYPSAQ